MRKLSILLIVFLAGCAPSKVFYEDVNVKGSLKKNGVETVDETSSQTLTGKKYQGGTASATDKFVMSQNTTANLTALAREQGSIYFDTDLNSFVGDDGSVLSAIGGGVSTPGSTTDNAVSRWDGTDGSALQDSNVTIDDTGLTSITNSGGAGVPKIFLDFNNATDQNPAIDFSTTANSAGMIFTRNGVEKGRIDDNGFFKASGFQVSSTSLTMTSDEIERATNQGKIMFGNQGATIPSVEVMTDNAATVVDELLRVSVNNAASKGVTIRGVASQTASLLNIEDSTTASIFEILANGEIDSSALPASPVNYTPVDATLLNDHLEAIDTAIGSAGGIGGTGTDNQVMRWDGTTNAQGSSWSINDVGDLTPAGNAQDIGINSSGNRVNQIYAAGYTMRPTTETSTYINFQIANNAVGSLTNNTAMGSGTTVGMRLLSNQATGLTPEGGIGIYAVGDTDAVQDIGILLETSDYSGTQNVTSADISGKTGDVTSVSAIGDSGSYHFDVGTNAGSGNRGSIFFGDDMMKISHSQTIDWWGNIPGIVWDIENAAITGQDGAVYWGYTDDALTTAPGQDLMIGLNTHMGAVTSGSATSIWIGGANVSNASSSINAGTASVNGGFNSGTGDGGRVEFLAGNADSGNGGYAAISSGRSTGGTAGNVYINVKTSASGQGFINMKGPIRYSQSNAAPNGVSSQIVNLTADDTNIVVDSRVVYITSDSATATDRTFTLDACAYGQMVTLMFDNSNAAELIDDSAQGTSGNHRLNGTWTAGANDTLTLVCARSLSDWVEVSRSAN